MHLSEVFSTVSSNSGESVEAAEAFAVVAQQATARETKAQSAVMVAKKMLLQKQQELRKLVQGNESRTSNNEMVRLQNRLTNVQKDLEKSRQQSSDIAERVRAQKLLADVVAKLVKAEEAVEKATEEKQESAGSDDGEKK